jgi:hypothetical protein
MTYRCRCRFILLSPLAVDNGQPVDVVIPGFPSVTFEMVGEAPPIGHWAIAQIGGFATEEEASGAGRRLEDMLLVVGAVTGLGVNVGLSRPSKAQWSDAARARVREQFGEDLQWETHGLTVYDEGYPVSFTAAQFVLNVKIPADDFEKRLRDWAEPSSGLTERQRTCAALINDSLFVPQTEGRFILRISAVEALCEQAVRDPRYQTAIQQLEQQLAGQTLDKDVRKTLEDTLDRAKHESVGHAYRTKFRTLRSKAEATAFDDLYRKRSKLVHEGRGRGQLGEAADTALKLATDLLEAELRQPRPVGLVG